jgi:hypothetical protein
MIKKILLAAATAVAREVARDLYRKNKYKSRKPYNKRVPKK